MRTLLHSVEPLTWNLFQPLETLTQKECIHNILFLKYLLHKEPNARVRQRIHYDLDQLTDHLLHLLDQAEMPFEGEIRRPLF
ncbi:hypothetical protein AHMF7605_29235 [Adhaeribacter arboris]|uniref:Uncharacterized protein n=1 Tax=Adhaeribacter arboris TaxID=2072846 RepID=A0A2T2Y8N3_9BACT|nr:hypothetical protein [Adhaeribacter arboris]PSR51856.1 hypothetical protein AHMF7605_28495 [Adhaeribacter arboris]PSR51991.1 hypothetical protein AHMF7605_29235 [Adhaeribacter arboris]